MSFGFYFDMTRCVGCRICQIACKDRLNLINAGPRPRRVDSYEAGEYPDAKMYHMSLGCNHCEQPACVTACPTSAMYKGEDGTMRYDRERCVGCGHCANSCPYHAPQVLKERKIARCDSCFTLRKAGMNPACVDACVMRCLDFGDMDELRAKYGDDVVADLPILEDSAMTKPNLLIKPKPWALEEKYRKIVI